MFQKILCFVTFGHKYWTASLIYLGLTLFLCGTFPALPLQAQSGSGEGCTHQVTIYHEGPPYQVTVPGCPEGQMCCEETSTCETIE